MLHFRVECATDQPKIIGRTSKIATFSDTRKTLRFAQKHMIWKWAFLGRRVHLIQKRLAFVRCWFMGSAINSCFLGIGFDFHSPPQFLCS